MTQKITQYGQYTTKFRLSQLLSRLNIIVPVSVEIKLTKHSFLFSCFSYFYVIMSAMLSQCSHWQLADSMNQYLSQKSNEPKNSRLYAVFCSCIVLQSIYKDYHLLITSFDHESIALSVR